MEGLCVLNDANCLLSTVNSRQLTVDSRHQTIIMTRPFRYTPASLILRSPRKGAC